MNIQQKEYDVTLEQLHGYEKIPCPEQVQAAKLTRYVTELDENRYFINANGEPEMTEEAQKEYDDFIGSIRERFLSDRWVVIHEGWGEGEDELEYHITAVVADQAGAPVYSTVLEIVSVVRIP